MMERRSGGLDDMGEGPCNGLLCLESLGDGGTFLGVGVISGGDVWVCYKDHGRDKPR